MVQHTHSNAPQWLVRMRPIVAVGLSALAVASALLTVNDTRDQRAMVVVLPRQTLTMRERIALRRKARLSRRALEVLGVTQSTIVATNDVVLRPAAPEELPPLGQTVQPFDRIPNWGNMHSPEEWERTYSEMTERDFVAVPAYDLATLTRPMKDFTDPISAATVPMITMKLYYSTIYCAPYTINPTGEYTGDHCAVDLKVADGTPLRAIGGGRVARVRTNSALGTYITIEHALPEGGRVVSIYAHLSAASVSVGQAVAAGDVIGAVGLTGNTTGPHLHLQIDRLEATERAEDHGVYAYESTPTAEEAAGHSVHPIRFIEQYSR